MTKGARQTLPNGGNIDRQLQRASLARQRGAWAEAQSAFAEVLQQDAAHVLALQGAVDAALALGQFEPALQHIQRLREGGQDGAVLTMQTGFALQHLGRTGEALAAYRAAIKQDPSLADAHYFLGGLHRHLGEFELALDYFQTALKFNPRNHAAANDMGWVLMRLDQPEQAVLAYQQAVALSPQFPEAHNNLGNVWRRLGRADEAIAAYACAIKWAPDFADAHSNLGLVFEETGKFELARTHYELALQYKPNDVVAHFNLGNLCHGLQQYDEAIKHFSIAIRHNPRFVDAYNNLGLLFIHQEKLDAAILCLQRAIDIQPDHIQAYNNLAQVFWAQGRLDQAVQLRKQIARMQAHRLDVEKVDKLQLRDCAKMFHNYFFESLFERIPDVEVWRELSHLFHHHFQLPLLPDWPAHANLPESARSLNIGYVSSDLRQHAVARFVEPIFIHHDRTSFKVFVYYNNLQRDLITDRIQGNTDIWCDCTRMDDDTLSDQIVADGIDILIDLNGHSAGNRMLAFARKPAPIQIGYLGYPGSTWLKAMDYRITDAITDPPGSEASYSETLLRLPDSLWCYLPTDAPASGPLPALQNGYLTFGSFNNFAKVDTDSIALWSRLLCAIPSAKLLIVTVPAGETRSELAKRFAVLGVAPERLEFRGRLEAGTFLEAFNDIDIALDPVNVHGATTTCEALQMGVPTLSLIGDRFLKRAGLSILQAAGVPEFAHTSVESYLAFARDLADDVPRLAAYRQHIKATFATAALTDGATFTKHFESLLRQAWKKWCAS